MEIGGGKHENLWFVADLCCAICSFYAGQMDGTVWDAHKNMNFRRRAVSFIM
jgi:hypothetical protein